jgi:hypothetical protein
LELGRATSRGEKEPSCREGQPGEREKDGRERRRRTTRMRHQWRLRSRAARLGPTTDPAVTIPNPNRPAAAAPAPARARHGHTRRQGEGWPRGRRRSEEGRCSGAGRAPTRAPFIIAVVDSPEVEKATDGRRAPRSRIEGGRRRGRESREEDEL